MDPKDESPENNLPSKNAPMSFLDLPRELRDMIYRNSIAAGHLGLLGTSKIVTEEACQFLLTHAILRVNMGPVNPTDLAILTPRALATAQYVQLYIDRSSGVPFDIRAIPKLSGGKHTIRKSCLVTINYGKEGSATGNIQYESLYIKLYYQLACFKRVVIKIVIEKYKPSEFEGLLTEEKFMQIFPYSTRLLQHHLKSYEKIQGFFEPILGPGKFDESVDGHCLEFHPLEPFPENWNSKSKSGSH